MVKSFVELLEISGVNEVELSLCFEQESRERWDGGGGGGSFGEDGEGLEGMKRDKKLERAEDAIGDGWIESEYCNFLSVFYTGISLYP